MNNSNKARKITLKRGKDASLRRFHPWIFSGAIQSYDKDIVDGDVVRVFSSDGEYLATGHYQRGSIAVRILSFDDEEIDKEFWKRRIAIASELRHTIFYNATKETNMYMAKATIFPD